MTVCLRSLAAAASSAKRKRAHGRVLVASMISLQITVRFLEGKQEARVARLVDPVGNPLEADQEIVLESNALALGQSADHRSRDQGRDQIMVGPELPECFGFLDHEGRQHDADLVAVERGPFAAGIARGGNRDPDPIGVRIAGDHQVRPS